MVLVKAMRCRTHRCRTWYLGKILSDPPLAARANHDIPQRRQVLGNIGCLLGEQPPGRHVMLLCLPSRPRPAHHPRLRCVRRPTATRSVIVVDVHSPLCAARFVLGSVALGCAPARSPPCRPLRACQWMRLLARAPSRRLAATLHTLVAVVAVDALSRRIPLKRCTPIPCKHAVALQRVFGSLLRTSFSFAHLQSSASDQT